MRNKIGAEQPSYDQSHNLSAASIVERHNADEDLRDRQQCLHGQREALEAAVNGAPLEASLGILVRTAIEAIGEGARAGFYLADEQQTALRHIVGMPPDYAEAVDGFKVGPDSLACGLATATGQAILTPDVRNEPLWHPWLWMAEKFDYRACWSFPIHTAGKKFIGTLAIYSRQPREATKHDREIGELLARTASIIISRHQEQEARRAAENALRESEARFRAFTSATSDVVYRMSADWREMRHLQGREFIADTLESNRNWQNKYIHPDDQPRMMEAIQKAIRCKSVFELEHRVIRKDGSPGWVCSRAIPILDHNDEIVEWFGAASDVTQRKQAEATQQMLVNELNHRVKNTLATVQAIAQQTLARAREPADFVTSFGGRIQSLARVHAMLSTATWQGADLRDLINDQVAAGPVDETRLTAWGPAVRIDSQLALHLALMLHELGTNACKYGALSIPNGWVTVNWTVDDALHLKWEERGKPLVGAPFKRGFGCKLIEQSARGQGGNAQMICEANGITWTIHLPLREHAAPGIAPQLLQMPQLPLETSVPGSERRSSLAGLRFLVVEDEPLIGLDIIAGLEEAQAEVEGPIGTTKEAIEIIEGTALDGVILDANLHGRPVDDIAVALTRRNVPFVFVTGYGREGLPAAFQSIAILGKPCSRQQVLEAAVQLVEKRSDVIRLRALGKNAK